jgi:hypothetical protein
VPALVVAGLGFLMSAAGANGGTVDAGGWWASIALAITLASFAPYSSAKHLVLYAIPTLVLVLVVGGRLFVREDDPWRWGKLVIVVAPVIVASVAAAVFCTTTVRGISSLLGDLPAADASAEEKRDSAVRRENATIARTSAQVVPFLRSIADVGAITESDRTLAAQLARQLRADLVTTSNRSWLDTVAQESGLVVSDPARLADRMNQGQKAALRGMLVAVMDNPVVDRDSLLIELRAQSDGSTAVAFSLDVDLPEGRRLMLLAPYFLTLKTTVDNLSWADGRSMLFEFQIPADGA